MKQLIQSYKTGELGLFDVPAPLCLDNGILVQTTCSLISAGTEKMIVDIAKKSLIGKAQARPDLVKQVIQKMQQEGIKNTLEKVMTKLDTPIPLGYSCAGRVIEVGKRITGINAGMRVACGGAGYASHSEINYIPKNLFVKIPDHVDDIDASFVTVGSIALQGIRQTDPMMGEFVVVIGLGLLGQLTVQLLKANGCRVIGCDLDEYKLTLAKKLGADEVCHSGNLIDATRNFTNGFGADAVIITASAKTDQLIYDAGEISRMKGRIIIVGLVGMNIPRDIFYKKELEVKLSMAYGPGRYDPDYEEHGVDYPYAYVRWTEKRNFEAFLNLINEGKITPKEMITHYFEFDEALKAYDLISGKSNENYLGIVLKYNAEKRDALSGKDHVISYFPISSSGNRLSTGLIGAGSFATAVILPHLKKNKEFSLSGICDSSSIVAHATAKKYNFSIASTSPSDFLQSNEINAVFITTRHNSHAQLVMDSLKNGKHTFVEKPLCLNDQELSEIRETMNVAAAKGNSTVLQVGYNRRFAPLVRKMKETVLNGIMAINYRINAGIIPLSVWIQDPLIGGGRIIGEVCHFIDTCSYLTASHVVSLMATVVKNPDQSVPAEDNVNILLNYANGSTAHLAYYAYGNKSLPKEFIEVFSNGLAMQLFDFRKLVIYKGQKTMKFTSSNQDKGFRDEFAAFADAVRTGKPAISLFSLFNTSLTTFRILDAIKTQTLVSVVQ